MDQSSMRSVLALAVVLIASPSTAPAQLVPCPTIWTDFSTPSNGCQVGHYRFNTFVDFYGFGPAMDAYAVIDPRRIEVILRMIVPKVTVVVPPHDQLLQFGWQDPFFEYFLHYELEALVPSASVFRAALTQSSGKASFDLSQATGSSGTNPYCTTGAAEGTMGLDHIQHGNGPGSVAGALLFGGHFCTPGPGPILATFEDVSLRYTLFLDGSVTPVPEPATVGLLALGLAALGVVAIRRRRREGTPPV